MLKEQSFYLYRQTTIMYVKEYKQDLIYTLMYDTPDNPGQGYVCMDMSVYDRWLPDFHFLETIPHIGEARYYKYLTKHPELRI